MIPEILFGLGSILLGGFLLWGAARLPRGVLTYALDPALFPRLVALGLLIFGTLLILEGWRKKECTSERVAMARLLHLLAVFGATVGYLLLWGSGCFLLNTFLYLFGIHLLFRFPLLPSVGSSASVTFATYLLFTQVFRVRLF